MGAVERRTERGEEMGCPGIWVKEGHVYKGCKTFFQGYDEGYYAIEKLAEYEDLEEQGLLIKLPCKVGDVAYHISRDYLANVDKWVYTINEVEVDSFAICPNLLVNVSLRIGGDRLEKTLTPYKTLFFTKAEAEAALERMK